MDVERKEGGSKGEEKEGREGGREGEKRGGRGKTFCGIIHVHHLHWEAVDGETANNSRVQDIH